MSSEELVQLLESGDLHGLMLRVVEEWLSRYRGGAQYAVVVAHIRDGVPDVQEPVMLRASVSLRREPS